MFGLHIFLFLSHCLLVQVQYYCHNPIAHATWVIEWVITILVSSGSFGATTLEWMNALNTLRGKRNDTHGIDQFKMEAYILFSPLLLLGFLIVLLVKSAEEYEQCQFIRLLKRWWTFVVVWFSTHLPCGDWWQSIF